MIYFKFRKALAPYYEKWYRDCWDSYVYCINKGDFAKAAEYLESMRAYFDIIINNWDAIDFFSVGDRAFLIDSALPVEFRGYE